MSAVQLYEQSKFAFAVHEPSQHMLHLALQSAEGATVVQRPWQVLLHDSWQYAVHVALSLSAEQLASQLPPQSTSQLPWQSNLPGWRLQSASQVPVQLVLQLASMSM